MDLATRIDPHLEGPHVVFSSTNQRECSELALVLEARSIPWRVDRDGHVWMLSVPESSAAVALSEIDAYRRENRRRSPVRHVEPQSFPHAWSSVIAFAAVLIVFAGFARELTFGVDWLADGRMDGGRLMAGQWWRAVTALMLHRDLDHLLGNVAFGGFFAFFVCRYWGSGLGWLGILAAGTLGNFVNGWVAGPAHLSIGASTAVFGALGILTAHTWRRGFPPDAKPRERIAPIVAGLGLLAFTGTGGENTDLGAHLFGFMAGFGIGALVAGRRLPTSRHVQVALAGGVWIVVVGAWLAAVLA
jgi:membrane associated rhomboid family serine protease